MRPDRYNALVLRGRRTFRTPNLHYCALALLLIASGFYRVRDTVDRVDEMRHGHEYARLPSDFDLPSLTLTGLRPEAEEAGLHVGDVIVGLGGRPLRGVTDFVRPLRDARAGDWFNLDVRQDTAEGPTGKRVPLKLRPIRNGAPAAVDWINFLVVGLALPYLSMALGFWVAAVRIRDPRAWLLLVVLLSMAEFSGGSGRTLFGRDDAFQPIAVMYQPALASVWAPAMMLFGIYFPERLEFDRRFPWAKWLLLVPILFHVLVTNPLIYVLSLRHAAAAIRIDRVFAPVRTPILILEFAAMLLFFAAMAYRTITASQPDARRRLLLLDIGAAIGVLPICTALALFLAGVIRPSMWIGSVLLVLLFVFPLTMAHVIVVHRAMDVRVAIRQGLRYLLARGTLRVIMLALITAISIAIARMSTASDAGIVSQIALVAAGIVAVLYVRKFADRLRIAIDRRFFREAYNAEQILSELANQVRTMVETGPLVETVVQRISETLHVPRVAILLNGGGRLRPAFALGYSALPNVTLAEDSGIVRQLRQESHARIGAADRLPWLEDAPPHERQALQELQPELLLPLSLNQKLVGMISLGPKRSEEPFSSTDLRLLGSLATQTGLALENSRLTAEIAAEVSQREKARREIEIAREVQERLFPQEYPSLPGLTYAGACRPALGVGGDYYDFILLRDRAGVPSSGANNQLGIAIGDVSGKGIPAALLMATLRAYLRGQTMQRESCLSTMIANLNTLVYESSATNRYATLFYSEYDASTRTLHYVNAGHNPPMVFRGVGCDVARLTTGGPAIGLLPLCSYTPGRVALDPGDLLVAFTDGISEAMNPADEDWGEERLIETVRRQLALPPRDLIARIMRAADAFAAGAPQHDDMTLVVVRVEGSRNR